VGCRDAASGNKMPRAQRSRQLQARNVPHIAGKTGLPLALGEPLGLPEAEQSETGEQRSDGRHHFKQRSTAERCVRI